MDKKPGLAILVGDALSKKGMIKNPPKDEMDHSDSDAEDHDEYLQEIAGDILKAVEDKDPKALADLLKEAFMCLDAMPHEEGEHDDSY